MLSLARRADSPVRKGDARILGEVNARFRLDGAVALPVNVTYEANSELEDRTPIAPAIPNAR